MSKFKYIVKINRECLESEQSMDPYGEWSSRWDNSFIGIERAVDDKYYDIESTLDIDVDEGVFVVWLEYSSGDSFGFGHRSCVDVVGITRSREAAEALRHAINNITTDGFGLGSLDCKLPDGQHIQLPHVPWIGYFDRLEEVHVTKTIME